MAAQAAAIIPALEQRPIKNTIVLFDVDNTLSPARLVSKPATGLEDATAHTYSILTLLHQPASPEMLALLSQLRHKVAIGYVGGSDFAKQQEQLGTASISVTSLFDFCFPENGLTAYRMGLPLATQSFINWIGEEPYKQLVRFILHYIADLDIPKKRGTFIEFRNGMINVSPIGRNASVEERNEYQKYDLERGIRATFVEAIKAAFPDLGLT